MWKLRASALRFGHRIPAVRHSLISKGLATPFEPPPASARNRPLPLINADAVHEQQQALLHILPALYLQALSMHVQPPVCSLTPVADAAAVRKLQVRQQRERRQRSTARV